MTILKEIVKYKKKLLKNNYYEEQLATIPPHDFSKNSYINILKNSQYIEIIAEIKLKSPTVSDIPKLDIIQQVKQYEDYGAKAISILTDEKYFNGSYKILRQLRDETNLPILAKDFVIDEIQIDLAKHAGANMILLIVNILDDSTLKRLYHYANQLGLDTLVEVHSKKELYRAHQLNPGLIGVNNRNLENFITHPVHTKEILNNESKKSLYITESGIKTSNDIKNLIGTGISGALIGEVLMKHDNLESFLPSLRLKRGV